jgi:chaperone modulatory protein CbpM
MTFAIVPATPAPSRLDLASFARVARLHPDLARRLVALGLIEADVDTAGELWFAPTQVARVARIRRLRAGLSINYAGLGVVLDLLDRVEQLQVALRRAERERRRDPPAAGGGSSSTSGGYSWT